MKYRGIDIKHPKQRGEWAELRFMTRAAELGFRVSKPFGDSAPYDIAVEHEGHFLRVQVKSTKYKRFGTHICHVNSSRRRYRAGEVDFVAAYVIPEDTWYIIPAALLQGQVQVCLSPHCLTAKYEPYREAWHLLRARPKSRAATAGR